MERSQVLDAMGQLKLYGMKAAYDEIIATAVKRQHEPQKIVGDLLHAEISEKQARSIKYQMTIARLPLAKEIDEFTFEETPVNETLVRDLAGGDFLDHQRNVVLIGGTGTGKSHLAVAIARACIRSGRRGRFFNVVDLVNKLDAETRADRQGRMADILCRLDLFAIGLERMATRWLTPRRTGIPSLRPDGRTAALPWPSATGWRPPSPPPTPPAPGSSNPSSTRRWTPPPKRSRRRRNERDDCHRGSRPVGEGD